MTFRTWFKLLILPVSIILSIYILKTLKQFSPEKFIESKRVFCLENTTTGTIPKRIHQIWNDDVVPSEFVDNIKGLVRDNPPPHWDYYFWTKESGLKFLADKYPRLYKRVKAERSGLLRSDILRYAVIHEYGGVYFDLDTVSVKPLDSFVDSHSCTLVPEPGEHYFLTKISNLITNSALACTCNHPFYTNMLNIIASIPHNCHPFLCSGPALITELHKILNKTCLAHLPDVESSELFQDVYDPELTIKVRYYCEDAAKRLSVHDKGICDYWRSRGKEDRTLSSRALTYHTWYHISSCLGNVKISKENNIYNLVPHVKIYGKTF